MKKTLTVLTLSALLLLTALPAMAGAIYGEFMFFGSWDKEAFNYSLDGEASQLTFGLNYPLINDFLLGAELSTGSMEATSIHGRENGFTLIKLKGGYYLINNIQTQLAVTGGFSKINLDDLNKKISGWMFGVDLLSALNNQLNLETALAFSLKGDYEFTERKKTLNKDCSILDLKIKLVYYLQSNLAATASYSYSLSTLDRPREPKYTLSGVSLGIKYDF